LESFPDNPITLEGLNGIYLNSAKALELKDPQVEALLAWVHAGGHLLVSLDQPGDVGATAWLKELLPATVGALSNRTLNGELHKWLTTGPAPGRGDLQYAYQPPPMTSVRSGNAAARDPFADLEPQSSFDQSS